jgi:hypothetical protein
MMRLVLFIAAFTVVSAGSAKAALLEICNETGKPARVLLTRADGFYAPETRDPLPSGVCLDIVDIARGTYFVDFFTDTHCHTQVVLGDEVKLAFDRKQMKACKATEYRP